MIVACYSIFNEAANIHRSLDSVKSFCDRIIVLDGAFEQYPHNRRDGQSDDGTVALVYDWMSKWDGEGFLVLPNNPWPDQRFKRSCYFRFGGPGDWFFVIDGDEVVESGGDEVREFLGGLDKSVDGVVVREVVQKQEDPNYSVERYPGLTARLIRFHPRLRYLGTYREIAYVDCVVNWREFVMRHHRYDPVRSRERRTVKNEFQTPGAFAAKAEIVKSENRSAGFQVRLVRWAPRLLYQPTIGRITTLGYTFPLGDTEEIPVSPLVLRHMERRREDNPT